MTGRTPDLPPDPFVAATERTPLRVAVVGCGDIAPLHLDAISANPDATLVAVADTDAAAAAAVADRYGVVAYPDLNRLLDLELPEVVHICTPHHLHAAMTIGCVARGVHVLLEKPIATTVADAAAVLAAAQSSAATVGVCFQNRYNSTSQAIRRLLDGGTMGALLGGRAGVTWHRDEAYYRRRPWRGRWAEAGGGVLINQAIHTLDLLQWFLGEATEVRGRAARLALPDEIEVEDTATIQLTHRSGARSIFYASNGYAANAPVTLELLTEGGLIRLDADLRIEHSDGRVEIVRETHVGSGARAYWGASHQILIDDFYRHVRAGLPFWIDPAAALASLRILTAVYEQSAAVHPS